MLKIIYFFFLRRPAPSPTRSCRVPRCGRAWSPATQTSPAIWTSCNLHMTCFGKIYRTRLFCCAASCGAKYFYIHLYRYAAFFSSCPWEWQFNTHTYVPWYTVQRKPIELENFFHRIIFIQSLLGIVSFRQQTCNIGLFPPLRLSFFCVKWWRVTFKRKFLNLNILLQGW